MRSRSSDHRSQVTGYWLLVTDHGPRFFSRPSNPWTTHASARPTIGNLPGRGLAAMPRHGGTDRFHGNGTSSGLEETLIMQQHHGMMVTTIRKEQLHFDPDFPLHRRRKPRYASSCTASICVDAREQGKISGKPFNNVVRSNEVTL